MPRRVRRVPARLALNLTIASLATLLTLVALEAGSYLFGSFERPGQELRVGNIRLYGRHDPLLFWSLRPGALSPGGEHWINSDGLRGPEVGPKEPGEFRILSLGESTTFAAQLRYEDGYSTLLERQLNERTRRGPVRVLNGGVPGYSLFQGVQFMLHRALALEPDAVLLYFGYNDFLPVAFLAKRSGEERGGLTDRELFELRTTARHRLSGFLTAHSNFYRGLITRAARDDARERRTHPGKRRVPAADRRWLLETARDFCERHGIRLVVVVPFYLEFEDHAELLRAFAQETGTPLVDLPATLPGRLRAARGSYFLNPVHPDAAGHRLIAQAIYETLAPLVP